MILWNNPLPSTHLKADQVEVTGDGLIKGEIGCNMYFQIKPKATEGEESQGQFSATSCQVTFEGKLKYREHFDFIGIF